MYIQENISVGFSTSHGVRHPLEVWERILREGRRDFCIPILQKKNRSVKGLINLPQSTQPLIAEPDVKAGGPDAA